MTRLQVKTKAKEDIRGRVFACFIPILIFAGIQILIDALLTKNTYGIIPILINIALYPINVGIAKIYMGIVSAKNGEIKIMEIFTFYKNTQRLGHILLSYVISMLIIIGGFILLIIPGIVFAIRYSMLPFILADNEDITWRDALQKCKDITNGRKGEIFGYYLSFLGWFILVALTAGILSIYVAPYFQATMANLYYVYNPKVEVISENQTAAPVM